METPIVDTVDVPLVERQGRLQELVQSSMPQVEPRYSFHAVGVPVGDALRLFARDNGLNLVLDRGLVGELTVDFVDLSLSQALDAMLDAHDYAWEMNQNLIRVRREITRSFDVDYLRLIRNSESQNESGKFGISGGDSTENAADNEFTVEQENEVDFWEELVAELEALIGEDGRVIANKTAGFVTVTASKRVVDSVENYLKRVRQGSMRQVSLQAKIVEVELTDNSQLGIDWTAPNLFNFGRFSVSRNSLGGQAAFSEAIPAVFSPDGSTLITPATVSSVSGGPGTFLRASVGADTRAFLRALQEQGDLNVVSQPRLKVINNQTAQIRVARDEPYYVQTSAFVPASGDDGAQAAQFDLESATIGLVVQVTPHVSGNGWITLEISPVITRKLSQIGFPTTDNLGNVTFTEGVGPPVIDVKQTTVVARVRSGETAIIGGLIQEFVEETETKVPVLGDLPMVGAAFRDTSKTKNKSELVIMITPTAEFIETADEQYAW
ncbi:MAG: secretin N-terminal domain-containing protein [Immundisolibacteraceae bacterium]|nr:secretin N-terminal domain-containing protein [Immundisolibacteraceae bacterium]